MGIYKNILINFIVWYFKTITVDVPIKEKNINFEINSIITYIISLNKKVEKMENELKNKSQLIEKQENEKI